jgi:pilus assembly protein CpaC
MTRYRALKTGFIKLAMLAAVTAAVLFAAAAAEAASANKRVELVAGKASTIELTGPVADVLVANPTVVDVGTLRANRLFLVGKTVGDTNVLAFDAEGHQLADINVHVKVDQGSLSGDRKSVV